MESPDDHASPRVIVARWSISQGGDALARGDEAADLVIRGGRVFSAFTREWLDLDVVSLIDGSAFRF
jgi:adenine deaminase